MTEQGFTMNRVPLRRTEYLKREYFHCILNSVHNESDSPDVQSAPDVIILTGHSGVGKTEAALQLFREIQARDVGHRQSIEACFSSFSTSSFLSDVHRFSLELGLNLDPWEDEQNSGEDKLGDILGDLCDKLNNGRPQNQLKCLLFDDAELSTSLIKHIDQHICGAMVRHPTWKDFSKRWKIIITTRDTCLDKWLMQCEFIKIKDVHLIEVFTLEETRRYMERLSSVLAHQKDTLHECLRGLPLALRIARQYLQSNMLLSQADSMDNLMKGINSEGSPSVFFFAMNRLASSLDEPSLGKTVFKMLCLLSEKNITYEILTSFAEVAISYSPTLPNVTAQRLCTDIYKKLVRGHLCDIADDGRRIFSFHKLVRESLKLFDYGDPESEKIRIVRMCLVALTRIIPKDGRHHQSHATYSYMCMHSESVKCEVLKLREEDTINLANTPDILLLYSRLLLSMAYCHIALRKNVSQAYQLLNLALKECIEARLGTKCSATTMLPEDLCNEETHLLLNKDHKKMIGELCRYQRLTEKDLQSLVTSEVNILKDCLENGHLNQGFHAELSVSGMILPDELLAKVYGFELLTDIFRLLICAPLFPEATEPLTTTVLSYGKMALTLCQFVREKYNVSLMNEVLIERKLLSLELKRANSDIASVLLRYEVLRDVGKDEVRRYGYEYGLRRTDFAKDDYHKQICLEEIALCHGKLYLNAVEGSDEASAHFHQGDAMFQQLLEQANDFGNFKTTSITYKKYAAFLMSCGKLDAAVRSVLDSMIYLNMHFNRLSEPKLSDQVESGKFKDLYKILAEYYAKWSTENWERADTMLQHSYPQDVHRIKYLHDFIEELPSISKNECPIFCHLLPQPQTSSGVVELGNQIVFGVQSMVDDVIGSSSLIDTEPTKVFVTHGNEMVYKMTEPRGRALIISNSHKRGPGGEEDYVNMKTMWEKFGFVTEGAHACFTAMEMVEAIHTETQLIDDKVGVSVHASYGAFVLIIFCHGSEGYVNGSDGKHIKHTSLIDLLSARNFPAMRGKPKIVIFHLCDYGGVETLQELLRMNSDAPNKTKATSLADGQPTSSSLLPVSTPLTREYEDEEEEEDNLSVADLFMFKSHVQNMFTEGESRGSIFVRAFVTVFYKLAGKCHMEQLAAQIQEVYMECLTLNVQESFYYGKPSARCTFTNGRKLYLMPGLKMATNDKLAPVNPVVPKTTFTIIECLPDTLLLERCNDGTPKEIRLFRWIIRRQDPYV